jgi:2-oxoglutarate ferredoxin oxidoreductase subunit alpha
MEARERLEARGHPLDVLRVRGFPFDASVAAFLAEHERTFVVEQNRDGQLRTLLVNEAGADGRRLVSVLRYGGLPLAAGEVVEEVARHLGLPRSAGEAGTHGAGNEGGERSEGSGGNGAESRPRFTAETTG